MRFPWMPQHLNCLMDSLQAELLRRGQSIDEIANALVQPMNFGFEVELGSRDWWLGGHSGVMFQRPEFHGPLRASWKIDDGCDIDNLLTRCNGQTATFFQTEWSLVPHNPHYGWNRGDIHVATILEVRDDGWVRLRDRMSAGAAAFSEDFLGWIDRKDLADAAIERWRTLAWSLDEVGTAESPDVRELLERSVLLMANETDSFAEGPHQHIVTGLAGLRYFGKVINDFAPKFARDEHTRMLLGVRLVDTARTVIGDRLLLTHWLSVHDPAGLDVPAALAADVRAWKLLCRVLVAQSVAPNPDMALIAVAIADVVAAEERTVDSMSRRQHG